MTAIVSAFYHEQSKKYDTQRPTSGLFIFIAF